MLYAVQVNSYTFLHFIVYVKQEMRFCVYVPRITHFRDFYTYISS